MDADAALARQLQEEENRLAALSMLRGSGGGQAEFQAQVQGGLKKVQGYEDELAQAMALSVMPLDELRAAAQEACDVSAAMGESPPLAFEDALAQELLVWFKRDFFSWVNNPPCGYCGSGATQGQGTDGPTPKEAEHGASRTEVYSCAQCGATTRFPRYNDPVKLLETRRGRCGEWANCFTLCCRAAGLDVRLVLDWTDHIWTEQWSAAQGKWVHLDPCEAAYDKPLLYSAGWGKKLSYLIAVGRDGAADVSRRYCKDWADMATRRTQVTEGWLSGYLATLNQQLRGGLPAAEREALEARDAADRRQMEGNAGPLTDAERSLPGRESGSEAWRSARGETGCAPGCQPGPSAASPRELKGTRYRLAKDEQLRARQQQWGARVCGGAVRASGENPPSETAVRACDGDLHTKWLDFGGAQSDRAWLEYRLPTDRPLISIGAYALTSANDSPERDPAHIVLEAYEEAPDPPAAGGEGGAEGGSAAAAADVAPGPAPAAAAAAKGAAEGGSWVLLDEQRALAFPTRHHRLQFSVGRALPARRWRLRVVRVADPPAANSVQLACWDLYEAEQKPEGQAAAEEQQG